MSLFTFELPYGLRHGAAFLVVGFLQLLDLSLGLRRHTVLQKRPRLVNRLNVFRLTKPRPHILLLHTKETMQGQGLARMMQHHKAAFVTSGKLHGTLFQHGIERLGAIGKLKGLPDDLFQIAGVFANALRLLPCGPVKVEWIALGSVFQTVGHIQPHVAVQLLADLAQPGFEERQLLGLKNGQGRAFVLKRVMPWKIRRFSS
ncbi:MAG: hypothetical protein GY717_18825 [Rhodobacteraceae bacterium]|nr:hypothetical protein [Paracoccaceae bacterium]